MNFIVLVVRVGVTAALFICPKCGTDPWCVVCDGTSLGFRKDLVKNQPSLSGDPRKGTTHADRVFIHDSRVR